MKKILLTIMLFSTSSLIHAGGHVTCPTLNAKDVEKIIDSGVILTDQSSTLAKEANKTNAQVLLDEPTANPFDTYYAMAKSVDYPGHEGFNIVVANVLGKEAYEARERAKKILVKENKVYHATYHNNVCMYETLDASANDDYPFKSKYETIVLVGSYYAADISSIAFKHKK